MNELQRTLAYVATAGLMAVAGYFLAPSGPKLPQDATEALIGKEFYKDFNPSDATNIEVISYDLATATPSVFNVEYQNGVWRIPSRYGYPADAKDCLAKAAASMIGLKREALAGKTEAEQPNFQVLDPKAEKTENLKGIGNRLTLKNGNTVLADYIIGKAVPGRTGYFYVRRPDEKQTFYTKVSLDLSTKFTDWIESDVLNLEGIKLTQLDILKHSLKFQQRRPELVGKEESSLNRKSSSDPWVLAGLDEATEEVNQDEVRKLVDALDNLKISGVRPKPEELRETLRSGKFAIGSQDQVADLFNRGFVLLQVEGGLALVPREGELIAGTSDGVEYDLKFGDVFEGTEEEIELGFLKPKEAADGEAKEDGTAQDDAKQEKPDTGKKSRFLFVTARVNPELFGPEPEEPVKPEPPAETTTEDAPEDKSDSKKTDEKSDEQKSDTEAKKTDERKDEQKSDEKSTDEADKSPDAAEAGAEKKDETKDSAAEPPQVDPKKAYDEALKKYEADQAKYDFEVKAREGKIKTAEEKIKSLNARFADWYYVISAENFEHLRPARKTLVKEKAADAKSKEGEDSASPPEDGSPEKEPPEKASPKSDNPSETDKSPK